MKPRINDWAKSEKITTWKKTELWGMCIRCRQSTKSKGQSVFQKLKKQLSNSYILTMSENEESRKQGTRMHCPIGYEKRIKNLAYYSLKRGIKLNSSNTVVPPLSMVLLSAVSITKGSTSRGPKILN